LLLYNRMPDTTEKPNDVSTTFTMNRILVKAKYSFYSALVFFLFANPETTLIFQKVAGKAVTLITPSGAITMTGIFINTVLFFLTMIGLMLLPNE